MTTFWNLAASSPHVRLAPRPGAFLVRFHRPNPRCCVRTHDGLIDRVRRVARASVRPRLVTTIFEPSNVTETEDAEQIAVRLYGDGFVAAIAGTATNAVTAMRAAARMKGKVPRPTLSLAHAVQSAHGRTSVPPCERVTTPGPRRRAGEADLRRGRTDAGGDAKRHRPRSGNRRRPGRNRSVRALPARVSPRSGRSYADGSAR